MEQIFCKRWFSSSCTYLSYAALGGTKEGLVLLNSFQGKGRERDREGDGEITNSGSRVGSAGGGSL